MENKNEFVCPYAGVQFDTSIGDDEISLHDIWSILRKKGFVVLMLVVLAAGMIFANVFSGRKYFDAVVKISPLSEYDIETLNAGNNALKEISPFNSIFYPMLEKNLRDRNLQAKFWEKSGTVVRMVRENNLNTILTKSWFLGNLSIKGSNMRESNPNLEVELSGKKAPKVIHNILNDFISYVVEYSCNDVIEQIKERLEIAKFAVHEQMGVLRKISKTMAQQKLVMLSELKKNVEKSELLKAKKQLEYLQAQKIIEENAEILRMKNRLDDLINQKDLAVQLGILKMSDDMQGKPTYAKGVKALQAEIGLEKRKLAEGVVSSERLGEIQSSIEVVQNRITNHIVTSEQLEKLQFEIDNLQAQIKRDYKSKEEYDLQEQLYLMNTLDFERLKTLMMQMVQDSFNDTTSTTP
ncbi:hypothetical protein [Desulfospira joergensenii]|uniref:hypothetical protein n=1 Tax=Desulfospira joergensenii TaxID=53329 RepID=UPI0003B799D5|nr:hypothetical protein [Desulfospira joergensenii]